MNHISIIKIISSLNTTIYFDVIKKEKQLHVSARGHRQVGSFGFARKKFFLQRPVNLQLLEGGGDEISFYRVWGFFWRVLGVLNV
jgi:hypothetical protein